MIRLGHYGDSFKVRLFTESRYFGQEYDPWWGQTGEIAVINYEGIPEESRNENTKGLDVALSFTVARIFLSCAFRGMMLYDSYHTDLTVGFVRLWHVGLDWYTTNTDVFCKVRCC